MTQTQTTGQTMRNDGGTTEEPQFAVVRRGWDRAEVGYHLERLRAQLQSIAADRDSTMKQAGQLAHELAAAERQLAVARSETARVHDQLRRLTGPPENVEGMSERMRWMLQLARDEAEEIRRTAAAQAAEIVSRAEEARVRNESVRAEIDAERAAIESTREQLLAAAHDEANGIRRDAADEQARLDAESVSRRAKIEDEFAASIAARRSEQLAKLAQADASSREEAERRRAEATEHARELLARASNEAQRKIASVELRLTQLRSMRRQVAEQLGAAHAALGQVLRQVGQGGDARSGDTDDDRHESAEPASRSGGPPVRKPAQPRPDPRNAVSVTPIEASAAERRSV